MNCNSAPWEDSLEKKLNSEFTNTDIIGTQNFNRQQTETDFYQSDYTFKLDYINPLNENITLESGALYENNDVGNEFTVRNLENGVFVPDSGLTNNFLWKQQVLGIYLQLLTKKTVGV